MPFADYDHDTVGGLICLSKRSVYAAKRKQEHNEPLNRGKQRNNTSGEPGVRWTEERWRAEIKVNGKVIHLGQFRSKAQAIKARREAAVKFFGKFRRTK